MKQIFLFLFLVIISTSLIAQEKVIKGKVIDTKDLPIPGATVIVKGSPERGTVTNIDGEFELSVLDSDEFLTISYVGMKPQDVSCTESNVTIVLEEGINLNEVVVTALGIKVDKKALGYATTQVNADEISAVKATNNFVNALNGKVAGVQISSPSSQPGSGTRIVIRGGSSITGNNEPLFVVNGVPFSAANYGGSSGLADIDPNSIESLSVLKGAAASALYGSNAANGVVLITLKSGNFDSKARVTLSHTSSFDQIYEIPLQKTYSQGYWNGTDWQYVDGVTSFTSTSWGPKISDVPGAKYYDRWDVFKTGYTAETNLSVSGGTDKSSFFVSYGNLSNDGILSPMSFKRNSINANTSFKFTPKLTVSSNVMYTKQGGTRLAENDNNNAFMNTIMAGPNTWNPYPIYDENGKLRSYRGGSRDPYLWLLDNAAQEFERDRFSATITTEYEILPTLKFRSVSGISTTSRFNNNYENKGGLTQVEGSYSAYEYFNRDFESTEMLTYDNRFKDFTVTAMVGHNVVENKSRRLQFEGEGLIVPDVYNTANVATYTSSGRKSTYRSSSLFAEARIGYKSILYYTITGRNDWVSSLTKDYFYPSHSLGFVFSELLPNLDFLTFGKFRASYAKVGAPAAAYATNVLLGSAGGLGVTWPFLGQRSYLTTDKMPNPDLTNEFKSEVELGVDLKLFNDKLGVDFAYYHNWSDNQILGEQFLASTGYTYGDVNIGGITHKGLELSVYGTPVQTKDFSWDIIVNWSKDNSEVDKLGTNNEPIYVGSYAYAIVGQSYPVLYGTGWLRDDQGRMVLNDASGSNNGQPLADFNQNQILGKIAPDWNGSIRNTFKYKRISLTAQIDIQKGGLTWSLNDHYLTYYGMAKHQEDRPDDNMITFDGVMGHYDYATQSVVVTSETPVPTSYTRYFQTVCQSVDEENIMPTDFIKLRELLISYELPTNIAEKMHMQGLTISFAGRNLWRKFKKGFEGPDTETNTQGIDNGNAWLSYSFPSTKTYSFTITANF